jgi:predicted phosphodiesterase
MAVMRVAALYDIHGNLPALEAVLRDARAAGVDHVLAGGDVLPGPMPRESLACLLDLDLPVQFIVGNGDREVVAPTGAVPEPYRESMRWNLEQLRPEDVRMLAGWPLTLSLTIDGVGDVLFCHATPRNDTEIFTKQTADAVLMPIFGQLDAALVVCGHTHMQFDRMIGAVRVVNAGSVGMPFGDPGAYWALLGPGGVELRRTTYDYVAAADRIRATAYPKAEEFAASNVLRPPSEQDILAAFSHAELK